MEHPPEKQPKTVAVVGETARLPKLRDEEAGTIDLTLVSDKEAVEKAARDLQELQSVVLAVQEHRANAKKRVAEQGSSSVHRARSPSPDMHERGTDRWLDALDKNVRGLFS